MYLYNIYYYNLEYNEIIWKIKNENNIWDWRIDVYLYYYYYCNRQINNRILLDENNKNFILSFSSNYENYLINLVKQIDESDTSTLITLLSTKRVLLYVYYILEYE